MAQIAWATAGLDQKYRIPASIIKIKLNITGFEIGKVPMNCSVYLCPLHSLKSTYI
jgi:hypothetical protein